MATAKLIIKKGRIISYNDRYFDLLSEDRKEYLGNGWHVQIKDSHKDRPGRIICHAECEYCSGLAVCHREFQLADGILGLAGGNIHSRYAYFRSEFFQTWLEDHNLQCVKHEDPNQIYCSRNPVSNYWSHNIEVETDGKITSSYEEGRGEKCQICGATYAIIRQWYCDGARWHLDPGILYTLVKDVTTINDIAIQKNN